MSAWILVPAVFLGACVSDAPGPPAPRRPNIVLFLADDLGYGDLGCYGQQFFETPNLDALAKQGLRLTAAYANAPNCAPTRAALMSGQYGPRTGIYTVNSSARGKAQHRRLVPVPNRTVLDDGVWTLAEALGEAGYRTLHLGKWHLGEDPLTQGFEVNIGGGARGAPRGYRSPYRSASLSDGPEGEYLTDRLASEACALLEEVGDAPFFMYFSFYAVHTPIQGRADLVERYKAKAAEQNWEGSAGFAAMVTAMDEAVGRVLAKLDEEELAEDTLVLFFSDNGGHGRFSDMGALRGAKGMLYEGGIREPFLARWPGRVTAGEVSDVPVIGVDLFPTLLEVAGVEVPEERTLDGVSLVPLLTRAQAPAREELHWHFPAYLEGSTRQQGRWRATPTGVMRAGDWKLLEFFEDGRLELYNLGSDPGEARDLSIAQPARVRSLHERMLRWRSAVGAPVPTELNSEYVPD